MCDLSVSSGRGRMGLGCVLGRPRRRLLPLQSRASWTTVLAATGWSRPRVLSSVHSGFFLQRGLVVAEQPVRAGYASGDDGATFRQRDVQNGGAPDRPDQGNWSNRMAARQLELDYTLISRALSGKPITGRSAQLLDDKLSTLRTVPSLSGCCICNKNVATASAYLASMSPLSPAPRRSVALDPSHGRTGWQLRRTIGALEVTRRNPIANFATTIPQPEDQSSSRIVRRCK